MSCEGGLSLTLERLAQGAARPADNVDLLKTLVTRIHARLKLQDCGSRLEILAVLAPADGSTLSHLVRVIELCRDPGLVGVTCSLIHDLLSPSSKGEVRQTLLRQCLALNTAEIIFRTLKTLAVDGLPTLDPCTHPAYQVIAKLASKDPKLAVKARLVGGVKLTHQLLQAQMKTTIPLLPLLMVTKYLAKNSTNQMMLGREGCVTTIVTILNSIPKTHHAKIKFIMEILALLTKTKSNVIRVVRESGLQRVLATLDGWEKLERRHQCKLVRATLATLSHVCDSKHGRKCVVSLSGVEVLQRFIQTCPADRKFDSSLASATNVFLKCVSRGELPVTTVRGAFTFQIPHILKEESTDTSNPVPATPGLDGDYSDEEEGDDDDDEGDDEGEDLDSSRSDLQGIDLTSDYCPERPRVEELVKLAPLFPEFNGFRIPGGTQLRDAPISSRRGSNDRSIESGGGWCGGGEEGEGGVGEAWENPEVYLQMSSRTRSLVRFVKVAYPDLVGARGPTHLEQLYEKDRKVCRSKALGTVERVLHPEVYLERVVYDLDYLLAADDSRQVTVTPGPPRPLCNWDEKQVGKTDATVTHLNFESRFESGNLRRVIQASNREYDLILNADVNSSHHHQWFYFEVSNMQAGTPYVFNITNNEKPNSEFNFGMKPVMFSVQKAKDGDGQWERTGYDICYHKNHYARVPKDYHHLQEKKTGRRVGGGQTNKCYYTATFTVVFPYDYDVCYLAYHYPYTYTRLQSYLNHLEARELRNDVFFSNQVLCHTLNGNPVPLLTITSHQDVKDKEVVLLTSRVHPGESNASWVLEGALEMLLGDTPVAQMLRSSFIFKVVPMLNPEGVIHGNQRCGLTDEDLNRRWRAPNPTLHPTIYHAKSLLEYLVGVVGARVRVFCDLHGHSRQKNVFMYGCSRALSWWPPDKDQPDHPDFMLLPRLAQNCMATFSLSDCHFLIEHAREATARVAVWRQFDIPMSYTMEASTCGCDQGPYKNHHLSTKQLLESGEGLCVALSYLVSAPDIGNASPDMDLTRVPKKCPVQVLSERSLGDFSREVAFWSADLQDDDLDSDDDLDLDLYGPV